MIFIKLKLEKQDEQRKISDDYDKLFAKDNKLLVILGPPGSGKSTLLEHLKESNPNISDIKPAKVFLMNAFSVDCKKTRLYVDGIDEYRSTSTDKKNVLYEISSKLREIDENVQVVLSCREMDWYGGDDESALKSFINIDPTIYKILPLDVSQQIEFIKLNCPKEELKESLKKKVKNLNIFSNPQMLAMLINVSENSGKELKSKIDLYEEYLMYALEYNRSYKLNNLLFTLDELINYAGYLACFNLLAEIDDLTKLESSIICNNDRFKIDKMETIRKSKIFSKGQFYHRTISEFLLAKFIIKYYLETEAIYQNIEEISLINSYFLQFEKIPTQLRGAYSWLCSLSKSDKLIIRDPYYQLINGDNSLFTPSLKIKLIIWIEEYLSRLEFKGDHIRGDVLAGFYTPELDDFFLNDDYLFETIKNHKSYSYKTFLVQILIDAKQRLSTDLKDKILYFLGDENEEPIHKSYFSKLIQDDYEIVTKLLEELKTKEVRNNNLIDEYLNYLYPEHISIEETVEYLSIYISVEGETEIDNALFLDRTKDEDKRKLIELLFKELYTKDDDSWPEALSNLKNYVENYFQDTIMKYPSTKIDAIYIFNLITSVTNKYLLEGLRLYNDYSNFDYKDWHEQNHKSLSEEFITIYFNSHNSEINSDSVFDFFWKYGYFITEDTPDLLIKFISKDNPAEFNKTLFKQLLWLIRKPCSLINKNKLIKIAEEYGLNDELDQFINPKKKEWQIRNEESQKKRYEIEQVTFKKNTAYFSGKDNKDIVDNWDDISFITNLVRRDVLRMHIPISKELFEQKLKPIIKNFVFKSHINLEIATISAYVDSGVNTIRNIDRVYLNSICLNDWLEFDWESESGRKITENRELVKYLYIVSVSNGLTLDFDTSDFNKSIETYDGRLAFGALTEYIKEIFTSVIPELDFMFISNLLIEDNKEIWKKITFSTEPKGASWKEKLIYFIIEKFNFNLDVEKLLKLKQLASNYITHLLIDSIILILKEKREDFNIESALAVYNMYEYPDIKANLHNNEQSLKIKIIAYLMDCYPDYASFELRNGLLSKKQMLGHYICHQVLNELTKDELEHLKLLMVDNDMWREKINSKLEPLIQQESDGKYYPFDIISLKEMILNKKIISQKMFFDQVVKIIKEIGDEIHAHRDNELSLFYHEIKKDRKNKKEEECRDIILTKLKDKYHGIYEFTKEKHESNNRVDINVKYIPNPKYEVQIECKLDSSAKLADKIKTQLIDLYLVKKEISGIYLIFEFNKVSTRRRKNITNNIPSDYQDRVKIVYYDLTKFNEDKKLIKSKTKVGAKRKVKPKTNKKI